ncbi:MAG TPA: Flp pilus assembly protein CpaB [Gemmatimonadota bacterium]|nr:Flp pilus assembly protein CpaB [Gemmatimonadota bacterium]
MQRKRLIMVLVLALVTGIGAGFVVLDYLSKPMESVAAEATRTRPVVVAARDLAAGTILQPLDVKVVEWPASLAPASYSSDESVVIGRGLIAHVTADEPLLESKLAERGQGGGLPVVIPDGMRAVSVKVDEVIGVAGFVLPGTRVDVLATFADGGDRQEAVTRVILQNVEALAAGQTTQPDAQGTPKTVPVITLLVSPEEAEDLTLAATQGQIQLALRGTLDQESIRTDGSRVGGLVRGAQPAPAPRPRVASRTSSSGQQVITYNGSEKTVTEFR